MVLGGAYSQALTDCSQKCHKWQFVRSDPHLLEVVGLGLQSFLVRLAVAVVLFSLGLVLFVKLKVSPETTQTFITTNIF